MAKYFIETSLPGDEGKYFRYIILTEKQIKKYIDWFKAYDWADNNDGIYYETLQEYRYTEDEILDALTEEAKPITDEQIKFLKKFCPGTRFDVFQRLINQNGSDDEVEPDDDDPENDEENTNAIRGIR